MERIRRLGRYQKSVLLATALMALVFTAVYLTVTARVGFAFGDAILLDVHEVSADVYTGKVRGETVRFTVNADRSVTFQRGERLYGPYTAAEDPTAVPADSALAAYMTGVELRRDGEVVFRGGVLENGGMYLLYREDGSLADIRGVDAPGDYAADESGSAVSEEPSVLTLLTLISGPVLRHKGQWPVWLGGVLLCVITALTVLFADELFRWHLSFRIRNADRAEPSDWEIAGRYLSWTALPLLALVVFILGLRCCLCTQESERTKGAGALRRSSPSVFPLIWFRAFFC